MLIFQICTKTPSAAFLSLSFLLSECYTWRHSHVLFIQKHLLPPFLSFPFLSSCSLSLTLSLSPSFLPAHFLPLRPLTYSHFHTISLALFGDACHVSCGFLTPAQDMKWLFCVYGRMGTEGEKRGEVKGKEDRRRLMFVGAFTESQIVWLQFGVYSSWREISDFCLLYC